MSNKSVWGAALMGLGQGAQFYGGLLAKDEMEKRADERLRSRQESLQEISQRFQLDMEKSRRTFDRAQTINDRNYQEGLEMRRRDPNDPLGAAYRADEEFKNDLYKDRYKSMYGDRGGLFAKHNSANFSAEANKFISDRFDELKAADPDLSDQDAYERAMLDASSEGLIEKTGSTSSLDASAQKSQNEIVAEVGNMERYELESFLVGEGMPEEDLEGMPVADLRNLVVQIKLGFFKEHSPYFQSKGNGLMDDSGVEWPEGNPLAD